MFLFPFFSVGVNLFFISLLDKYESDIILNPLFQCAPPCRAPHALLSATPAVQCMVLGGMRAAYQVQHTELAAAFTVVGLAERGHVLVSDLEMRSNNASPSAQHPARCGGHRDGRRYHHSARVHCACTPAEAHRRQVSIFEAVHRIVLQSLYPKA